MAPTIVQQNLGQWQTTDSNGPIQIINNLPSGKYVAEFELGSVMSGAANTGFAINDGTTTCAATPGGSPTSIAPKTISCSFSYNNAGNRTFQIYGASSSGTLTISLDDLLRGNVRFKLYYFGSSSVYAAPANENNVDVFSAKVSSGAVVSDENINWINGNASNPSTGNFTVTFNTGIFTVAPNCAVTVEGGSSSSNFLQVEISSISSSSISYETGTGTPADSNQSVQIICQKQGADFTATRLITGQFKELMTVPNVTKPKTCYYAFGGASATLASPTECTTGTCVEVVDTCGTVSPPAWITTAVYRDVTFANGTWANSSAVQCSCVSWDTTSGLPRQCQPFFETGNDSWSSNASGGLVISLQSSVGSSEATGYIQLKCEGQAP